MKKQVIAGPLVQMGLCILAVLLMGGGTECPKTCVVEGAACETYCESGLNGVCIREGSALNCSHTKPNERGCNRCSSTPGMVSRGAVESWLVPILFLGVVALVRRWRLHRHE